jgi:hypothetical protein
MRVRVNVSRYDTGDVTADGKPRLPRFVMVAYTGGMMRIANWRYPVVVDLAGLAIPSQSRPIRFGHDMASGVGHTDTIKIEDGRLLATGVVSRDTAAANATMLEAACLMTAGLADAEKLFDDATLDAANRRYRGSIGLQELLLEAAWANGYTGRNFRDSRAVLRFAFRPELEAGFSTVDIGGILSNVANKFLLDGFFSATGSKVIRNWSATPSWERPRSSGSARPSSWRARASGWWPVS